jgi:hypothetical protein
MDTDILQQFVSVTGVDPEFAISFLETNGWDLEHCINLYLEGNQAQLGGNVNPAAELPEYFEEGVRAPILPKTEILVEDDPFERHQRRRHQRSGFDPNAPRGVFEMFRDFSYETKILDQTAREGTTSQKKLKTLADLFRPPLELIERGTFEQVRQKALAKRMWMLVNVQTITEFDCQRLNRDTWSDTGVKSIVTQRFMLWQVLQDSDEGARYCRFYPVNTLPHIAVIDPRTGERVEHWQGFVDPVTLVNQLNQFLETHDLDDNPEQPASLSKRKGRGDIDEEEQMLAAIAASLQENTNRKQKANGDVIDRTDGDSHNPTVQALNPAGDVTPKSERKRKDIEMSEPLDDKILMNNNIVQDYQQQKSQLALDPDPALLAIHLNPSSECNCVIQVRLPNGSAVKGYFRPTDTILTIFQYVALHMEPMTPFTLLTAFPKRVFSGDLMSMTLQQADLVPRAALICERSSG